MEDEVNNAYWNKYVSTWSFPNVAAVMARVPSICMWDGSYYTEPVLRLKHSLTVVFN
jgi:hypothetical protein